MLNSIYAITYRSGEGVTYVNISRPGRLQQDLEVLAREQPRATVISIDRQGGN